MWIYIQRQVEIVYEIMHFKHVYGLIMMKELTEKL